MASDKYSRPVSLVCSTCGGRDFEYDDTTDTGPVRCTTCDRTFTRDELMRDNQARIDDTVGEIGKDIVGDLQKSLKDALKGSKNIRFK